MVGITERLHVAPDCHLPLLLSCFSLPASLISCISTAKQLSRSKQQVFVDKNEAVAERLNYLQR